jgi:hypothetical protein
MSPLKSPRGVELLQGETITLRASAVTAAVVGATGTAVYIAGERRRYIFILDVTAAATDAADTLDVYVDWSLDNLTWTNGGHFTQCLGNGGAKRYYMVFDPSNPGTTVIDATSDAANSTVRPALFGPYVRARWTMVDADVDGNFTWSAIGYAL